MFSQIPFLSSFDLGFLWLVIFGKKNDFRKKKERKSFFSKQFISQWIIWKKWLFIMRWSTPSTMNVVVSSNNWSDGKGDMKETINRNQLSSQGNKRRQQKVDSEEFDEIVESILIPIISIMKQFSQEIKRLEMMTPQLHYI